MHLPSYVAQPSVESRYTLAIQTNVFIEKANRLIDLCRKRSLKHNDKTQVWLSHVCIDCRLDESFIPPCAPEVEGGVCTILPTFTNKQGKICKRKLIVEGNDVFASFQKCLKGYSKLIKKETLYDKFTKLNDSEEWLRGLFLLVDSYSDSRKVYHDMPPIFKDAPYRQASATYTFKEMEELECVLDELSSGKVENGVSYQDVSKLWQADPGARWVLHWVDIFEAIEMSTQGLVDLHSLDDLESETLLAQANQSNINTNSLTLSDKERRVYAVLYEADSGDLLSIREIMDRTERDNDDVDIVGKNVVSSLITKLINHSPPYAERPKRSQGAKLTRSGISNWENRERKE